MGKVMEIISGMGMLILVYLLVTNSKSTATVVNSLGSNLTSTVKVLQGR